LRRERRERGAGGGGRDVRRAAAGGHRARQPPGGGDGRVCAQGAPALRGEDGVAIKAQRPRREFAATVFARSRMRSANSLIAPLSTKGCADSSAATGPTLSATMLASRSTRRTAAAGANRFSRAKRSQ